MEVKFVNLKNDRLRIKLTDACNLKCPFCHFEGAPGAKLISPSNEILIASLEKLREHYSTIWLTGGEPTIYPYLAEMIYLLKKFEYKICMVSNGLFDINNIGYLLEYFEWINISFHSCSPVFFQNFIHPNNSAQKVIDIIKSNIILLKNYVPIAINAVVNGVDKEQQLDDVYDFAKMYGIPLKLVPDWRTSEYARQYIIKFLDQKNYQLAEVVRILPGSNVRKLYFNPDSTYKIEFKDIEPFKPNFLCSACDMQDKCIENFAFIRIEENPIRFRLCIHKPSIDPDTFFDIFETKIKPMLQQYEYTPAYHLNNIDSAQRLPYKPSQNFPEQSRD